MGLCGLLWGWGLHLEAQAPGCPQALSENQKKTLTDYVRKKYKLVDTIALTLKNDTMVRGACFRELTFEGKSAFKTWELTLYASPDARFLSSDLFDTTFDPALEKRAKDEALLKGLTQGPSATRGPANAPVTIVEFSDFQCPFCGKFARILDEALSSEGKDVRVVFHHMPLSMHPWARMAAEAAGCAQLQSNEAFWSLHDRIFQGQTAITAGNAKEKLAEFASATKGIDATVFEKCLATGMSVGLVLKDMNVAESYQVNATPTVFINGHRLKGVDSAAKLREMMRRRGKRPQLIPRPRQRLVHDRSGPVAICPWVVCRFRAARSTSASQSAVQSYATEPTTTTDMLSS
jgi:protein-disulfide isomerase